MSRRAVRLLIVPAVIFAVVWGTVFTLAELHPAKPEATTSTTPVQLGDAQQGASIFADRCAGCHGQGGKNGTVGPTLAGNPISLPAARAQIENGGGAMPANLVEDQDLADVLAYLKTVLAG
jgi:mono/diheme cytochrome c family protein